MKTIHNGFRECYQLNLDGKVYNSNTGKELKSYKGAVILYTQDGTQKKISIKKLYRLVYGTEFVQSEVQSIGLGDQKEEWKELENAKGYYISNLGRVKSRRGRDEKMLHQTLTGSGYAIVQVRLNDGRQKNYRVSRLVAQYFLPLPEEYKPDWVVHHKNGVRTDNDQRNLMWISPEEHYQIHRKMKEEDNNERGSQIQKSQPKGGEN